VGWIVGSGWGVLNVGFELVLDLVNGMLAHVYGPWIHIYLRGPGANPGRSMSSDYADDDHMTSFAPNKWNQMEFLLHGGDGSKFYDHNHLRGVLWWGITSSNLIDTTADNPTSPWRITRGASAFWWRSSHAKSVVRAPRPGNTGDGFDPCGWLAIGVV